MKRSALGAIAAQGSQALASFVLQILVARILGLEGLGVFAILYGVIVLASGILTGFVGDSLVVLDRFDRRIRSALQQYSLGLGIAVGIASAIVAWATGLIDGLEATIFAAAILAFCLEEILRRVLMAHVMFWKVAAVDLIGFAGALAVLGTVSLTATITLSSFLFALTIGQTIALIIGAALVPKADRFLVGFVAGGHGQVASYGTWRSLQQFLRPALLTVVRTLVTMFAGLAATGLLEAARIYVAPALLVISGLSSFLFVSFARSKDTPIATRLRRADRAVLLLVTGTLAVGVIAVVALPLAGPLLFGVAPDLIAVLGWLGFAASVAAVTPYGALAAVAGKQATVFWIRTADTVASIGLVVLVLALGLAPAVTAVMLSIGSLAGGAAIRFLLLRPLARGAAGA